MFRYEDSGIHGGVRSMLKTRRFFGILVLLFLISAGVVTSFLKEASLHIDDTSVLEDQEIKPAESSSLLPLPLSWPELYVTVQTDKDTYAPQEEICISGVVYSQNGPVEGALVGIEVKDSKDRTIFIDAEYSSSNGSYERSFRLPPEAPQGIYHVYVTAEKPGYISAANSTTFHVRFTLLIWIAGYDINREDSTVTARMNITMLSHDKTSWSVKCRFEMCNPRGEVEYDRYVSVTLLNNTVKTVQFSLILETVLIGAYTCKMSVYSPALDILYDTTGWIIAFIVERERVAEDLGIIRASSSITDSMNMWFYYADTIRYTFAVEEPIKNLTVSIDASKGTRIYAQLIKGELAASYEFNLEFGSPRWVVYNLPAGEYELKLLVESVRSYIGEVRIATSEAIREPLIEIVSIKELMASATPGGLMAYSLKVRYEITAEDIIQVNASVNSNTYTVRESRVSPLHGNEREFYFSIEAPSSPGEYNIVFTAKLVNANVSDVVLRTLRVSSICLLYTSPSPRDRG